MALKKRLTIEEHRAAAQTIRRAQQMLDGLAKELLPIYGASSRIGKIAERIYATGRRSDLDELRSRLDDAWYAEGYERAGQKNPYYGRVDDGWHPIPPASEHLVWH